MVAAVAPAGTSTAYGCSSHTSDTLNTSCGSTALEISAGLEALFAALLISSPTTSPE